MKKTPRMTLDDVLEDMRSHGMSMAKDVLSQCLRQGVFPFATVLGVSPTGKAKFLIMRRDYEKWAQEYLNV